jgi:hypothetical protein
MEPEGSSPYSNLWRLILIHFQQDTKAEDYHRVNYFLFPEISSRGYNIIGQSSRKDGIGNQPS